MPPKVRDIIKNYMEAGFEIVKGGKGSHRKLRHSSGVIAIVSGKDKDDAKPYQEKDLKGKIMEARNKKGKKQ